MRRGRKLLLAVCLLAAVLCAVAGALLLAKKWNLNQYLVSRYAFQGVDVSHHQGTVDWETLAGQGIDFAFIKATEGSSHLDEKFAANWQGAAEAGVYAGAYHFFSFDSAGSTQAEWYIQTVGDLNGRLAPVADVEYYGDKELHPPEKEAVIRELREFLRILEECYQVKPVIYTTYKVYRWYLEGEFDDYPLWIRNVYYPPDLDLRGRWQFWQYTDTAVLPGYEGAEPCIDRNVFVGTEEEFAKFVVGTEAADGEAGG